MRESNRWHASRQGESGLCGGLGSPWPDVSPAALDVAADVFGELVRLARERSPDCGLLLAADGSPARAIDLACELNRPEGQVREAMAILEARGLIESEGWPPAPATATAAGRAGR